MEDEALSQARAAEVVRGRDDLRRHRPRLQRVYTAPARTGACDGPERWHGVQAALGVAYRQPAHRGPPGNRPRSPAHSAAQAAERGVHQARDGRRDQGRDRGTRVRGRRIHERRQDRDRAGHRHQAKRKVRRETRRRAVSRSFAVHRVCAARQPENRARRNRRERRLRCPRRGAACAHRARLLHARQASARHGARGRCGGAGGKRLMAMESALPLRRIALRLTEGIDGTLLVLTLTLSMIGFAALYSASYENPARVVSQVGNLGLAFCAMWLVAQVPPQTLMRFALPAYLVGLALLVAVALAGDVVNGARRWLHVGVTRFQPSEMMKLAVPMMLAWYFHRRETALRLRDFVLGALLLALPLGLIARQPDLGTAALVGATGFYVIFFAGISWKVLGSVGVGAMAALPLLWGVMKDYQRKRVLTLLDPTTDPLGAGYHIIQSTIAVGSGGLAGKGWLYGTQSHLEFIPERHTDFIFAVFSEEFGLIGNIVLLVLYALLVGRGLMIAANAPTVFSRLFAGSIALMFFTYAFVNMGMVSGILPVVGVPLPFVSYGGTALLTLFIGIGVLMSVNRHRKLVQT